MDAFNAHYRCISTPGPGNENPSDILELYKHIALKKDGQFSFRGSVPDVNAIANPLLPQIGLNLSGRFLTPTSGTMTLTIHYRSCGTYKIKIHRSSF